MHKRLSIIPVWMATLMMLLSTVVMHHHHYERVCIVTEHCDADTATAESDLEAEEGHSHQETDRGSCRMHQLHRFITNANTAKDIRRHIIDGTLLVATLPNRDACIIYDSACVNVRWQHAATAIHDMMSHSISRRGPPVCSL